MVNIESFANKEWNPATYALLLKYKDGLLSDYIIIKERLQLDIISIDAGTLVDLIGAGSPDFILNKIDRD